jgi:putative phosphoribosyl transferase
MFSDRHEAGRRLASSLDKYRGAKDVIVLGIPRGGVVVAWEVAHYIGAPLDIVVVKKLGYPGNPEFAIGAATPDGYYLNTEISNSLPKSYVDEEVRVKQIEAREKAETLMGTRKTTSLAGKTVIVVDDGVATGASMIMALRVIRQMKPTKIVVAVPVAPPEAVKELRLHADDVVALTQPTTFYAIGQFYADFTQVEDDEAKRLLQEGSA